MMSCGPDGTPGTVRVKVFQVWLSFSDHSEPAELGNMTTVPEARAYFFVRSRLVFAPANWIEIVA
jgi:hypothetical protein